MFKSLLTIILVVLFIAISQIPLFCEVQRRMPIFMVMPTTGIFSGIGFGAGVANIYEDKAWELTLNFKKRLYSHAAGPKLTFEPIKSRYPTVYLQANKYWNSEREKSFLILKLGGFLSQLPSIFPTTGVEIEGKDLLLLISIGYGYSFKISNMITVSPSIDFGLQPNLLNAGVAIKF